nr:amidohydrolase family protein [Micromonospora sp. DSM 115978]
MQLDQPGIEVQAVYTLSGERTNIVFLSGVVVEDRWRIGEVDGGWTVGTRWMFHERMLHNSPFVTVPAGWSYGGVDATFLVDVVKRNIYISPFWEDDLGKLAELIGEDHVLFGSDYPHPEGLAEPRSYLDDLAHLPEPLDR